MKWFAILLVLCFSSRVIAQTPGYLNFTIEHGLPGNLVYCALQDREVYLWFGTDKGLYFFRHRKDIGKGLELLPHLERIALEYTGDSQITACKLYNEHTLVIANKKGFFLLDLDAFYGHPRKVLLRPFNHCHGYDFG